MNNVKYKKYYELHNKYITKQEAEKLGEYSIEFYEYGVLKKVEHWDAINLSKEEIVYDYYIDSSQTHEELFNSVYVPEKEGINIVETKIIGTHKLLKEFGYDENGVKDGRRNFLFDENGRQVGYELIDDIVSDIPVFRHSNKHYYNNSVNCDGRSTFDVDFYADDYSAFIHFECFGYQNDVKLSGSDPDTVAEIRRLTGMSQNLAEWYVSNRVIPTTDLL